MLLSCTLPSLRGVSECYHKSGSRSVCDSIKPYSIIGARYVDESPPQTSRCIVSIEYIHLILDLLVAAVWISPRTGRK